MAKAPKKEEGYFKAKELTCKCGCGKVEFDLGFLATLNAIREECGFSFALSSAYRYRRRRWTSTMAHNMRAPCL